MQSIPAVFALRDRKIVDSFIGALPEAGVREFVDRLAPPASPADRLVEVGTEDALRAALDLQPDHPGAVVALAELLVGSGSTEEALALLARIPETAEVRRVAALARMGGAGRGAVGRRGVVEARRAARPGQGRTRRLDRSSSTCWRCSVRTTPGR